MKTFTWMLALTASFLTSALLLGSKNSYAETETYGTMMVVKGEVKVTSAKNGKVENAKVGFKVHAGDSVTSGADSRAKIIMSDKNVINVSPDSKVTITKYENSTAKGTRNVELKVDYGKVRASVEQIYDGDKSKFNIRTPTAVAGVRGTDFIAGFNPGTRATTVVTFSGVVAVGTPGPNGSIGNPVFVKPGQTTSVNEGAKPETPKAVPQDQMKNMNQESSADTAEGGPSAEAPASSSTAAVSEDKNADANFDAKADTKADANSDAKADRSAASSGGEPKADGNASSVAEGSAPAAKNDGSAANSDSKNPSGNKSGDGKPAAPGTSASTSGDAPAARAPASIPTVSMINSADMDIKISDGIKAAPEITKGPTTTFRPPTPVVTTRQPNQFIDNAIRNQRSRVKVELCLPGTGC